MSKQTENIVDYCKANQIKFFGIGLKLENGKKTPEFSEVYGDTPKMTDFINLSNEELLERQKHIDWFDYLAIDTSQVKQVDIDFKDNQVYNGIENEYVNNWIDESAYFNSLTKKQGKHIFFNTDNTFNDNNRPQTKLKDIEILSGQWSFCKKNEIVHNSNKLYFMDNEVINKIYEPQKKGKKIKSSKKPPQAGGGEPPNSQEEVGASPQNEYTQLLMDCVDLLPMNLIDNYNTWVKLIWALHNDADNNNYKVAKYMSQKGEKYDEDHFNKIWTQSKAGVTIGTFFHFAKQSDEKAYFKLKSKGKIDWDNITSDVYLANLFLSISGTKYILIKGLDSSELYTYHRDKWIQEDRSRGIMKVSITKDLSTYFSAVLSDLFNKQKELIENEDSTTDITNKIKLINSIIGNLNGVCKLGSISDAVLHKLACANFEDIEFDNNPNIFAFRNKTYNLNTGIFIEPQREDYILTTTGYDYEICDPKDVATLESLFDKIFPDKTICDYYKHVLATALYGHPIEKFFIANGSGGNGKGVLNELMQELLGNYCYTAPNAVLLTQLKSGNNPEVAGMNNKRLVIYREPTSSNKKLCLATIKELTGGSQINARMNYSNNTKTRLRATHILECNEKPKIDGRLDESAGRRLADIPFVSTFTTDEDLLVNDHLDNVFKADGYFKSDDFKNRFKFVLFDMLIKFMTDFKTRTGKYVYEEIIAPPIVLKRTKNYIVASDELKEWFDGYYELIPIEKKSVKEIIDEKLFVKCKDVFNKFKQSEHFLLLSKTDKRTKTQKWFYEYLENNLHFKMYFKTTLASANNKYTNCLIYFKERDYIESDDDEDEDQEI